ncbi:putative ribonuclease H-like domain-containing protein [Tanacetum coccineum]
MVPRTVLTRSGLILVNAARPVNIVQSKTAVNNAGPTKNDINNAYSTTRRPFNKITAVNNSNFTKKVNTIKGTRVNTARPKVVLRAVMGNMEMRLRPQHVRHMTGNKSYLTDYEEIDEGFVSFRECNSLRRSHLTLAKATPDESNLWHRRLGHVNFKTMNKLFSENTPNIAESRPNWVFDIDALTKSMNYKPVVVGNQSNGSAGTKACDNACKPRMETVPGKDYILLLVWHADPLFSQSLKSSPDVGFKPSREEEKKDAEDLGNESGNPTEGKDSEVPSTEEPRINQEKDDNINSTNNINTASDGNNTNNVNVVSSTVNAVGSEVNVVDPKTSIELPNDPNMPELEDIVYSDDDEDVGAEADMNNLDAFMPVSPIPTTRIHKDHPVEQIIGDLNSTPQTRRMTKNLKEHEAMQKELLHNQINKKFEPWFDLQMAQRAIVAQGYTQEEGIDCDEMDVNSGFSFMVRFEEVSLCLARPLRFEDHDLPDKRGKIDKNLFIRGDNGDILLVQMYVDDIIFGSIKKSLCTEFEKMMHKKFQMSSVTPPNWVAAEYGSGACYFSDQ